MNNTTRYTAFSGGIDSTALALLNTDDQLIFTDTGWEFPHIYEHLDRFEAMTGRKIMRVVSPEGTLPDYIRRKKFLPNHGARFCTRIFKIEALEKFVEPGATIGIGLRADEPDREERVSKLYTLEYPLRDYGMGRGDCVKLCLEADLLPRYPTYMARGGCIGCFYKRAAEIRAMHHFVPEVLDELQALEEEIQDTRGKYFIMFPNIGMSIRDFRAAEQQQTMMFDLDTVYSIGEQPPDKGIACGLFCNR